MAFGSAAGVCVGVGVGVGATVGVVVLTGRLVTGFAAVVVGTVAVTGFFAVTSGVRDFCFTFWAAGGGGTSVAAAGTVVTCREIGAITAPAFAAG